MREVRKNLLQAIIISAIVTGVLALYAYVPLILGDEKVILEMLWFPTIWSIGFFCISTMVLYVGLNEYRKTRKIWDGVRSALYWRAKVRMITFVGFVMFFLLYILFCCITDPFFPAYSIMISVSLSIVVTSLVGVAFYRFSVRTAKTIEEEWKKLDEERKRR